MTIKEQIMKLQTYKMYDGEDTVYVERDDVLKALEQQSNRCDSCTHSEEQDGSNCYECVKGMADNFEAQPTEECEDNGSPWCLGHCPYRNTSQCPYEEQPRDAVSRILVHEAITASIAESENPYEMWQRIEALPSVTPERPKGKWIKVITDKDDFGETWHFKCSICGKKSNKGYRPLENYCHNCGAEMEVNNADSD